MLTPQIRQALIHELHTRRVPVDLVARYLLTIETYERGEAATTLPCPRCYASGMDHPLRIAMTDSEVTSVNCGACAAVYDLREPLSC